MSLARRRVLLFGVVGVIYEARPNVTIDIAALCLKPVTPRFCEEAKRRFL